MILWELVFAVPVVVTYSAIVGYVRAANPFRIRERRGRLWPAILWPVTVPLIGPAVIVGSLYERSHHRLTRIPRCQLHTSEAEVDEIVMRGNVLADCVESVDVEGDDA